MKIYIANIYYDEQESFGVEYSINKNPVLSEVDK